VSPLALEPPAGLVERVLSEIAGLPAVRAVALAGSFVRGTARQDSDVDFGVFYDEAEPPSPALVRSVAKRLHDANEGEPVVTAPYEWGPFVNGGAWLVLGGRRVDLLYRNLDQVRRVVADCRAGRIESHFEQQPPFGYFSWTYLGDLRQCRVLHDPAGTLAALKAEATTFPPALRAAIVREFLWSAEFTLLFAQGFAARRDVLNTSGCMTRCARALVQVLFARNEVFFTSDKTALSEIERFTARPRDFEPRLEAVLADLGSSGGALASSVEAMRLLVAETAALCPEYRPKYPSILA
jgi:predicted nucleotidyltransferase